MTEAQQIIPVSDLSPEAQDQLDNNANWKLEPGGSGSWYEIVDSRYGRVIHVVVVGPNGEVKFDKLNIQWSPAVFVMPVRINPKGKAEFLLPEETRILLRDENGRQGAVRIENIPQGLIKVWEDEEHREAALR